MKIKITLLSLTLGFSSVSSLADYEKGVTIGGGVFGANSNSCEYSGCSYSGAYFDIGYDINKIVSIEAKYGTGSSSYVDDKSDLTLGYAGVNAGYDFGTKWFNPYGKIGLAKIKEEESIYYSESTEVSPTLGIGARFFLSEDSKGTYAKLEALAVRFQSGSTGVAYIVGIGYKF